MKKNTRKLELKSSTIRVLSSAALANAAGGRQILSLDSCSISGGTRDEYTDPAGKYTCSCAMNCVEP